MAGNERLAMRGGEGIANGISEPAGNEIKNPGTVLVGILLVAILFQVLIYKWQSMHYRSFLLISLLGLWLLPMATALQLGYGRFLAIWTVYSLVNAVLLRRAMQKPLALGTPRLLYRFYRTLFNLTMGIAAIGYFLFLLNIFIVQSAILSELAILLLFYGLYFGVMSRDLIDFASDRMASTMGYYNRDGLPQRSLHQNICAICGQPVCKTSPSAGDQQSESTLLVVADRTAEEPYIILSCQHVLHSFCLHGWCLIGKKDTCPYCREKVDLALIQTNPWRDPEFVYGKFLDLIRYLVVWQPILFSLLHIAITLLKST